MSPGNQGVFQLLKEVTFRRIVGFCSSRKWGHFEGICSWLDALWLAGGIGPKDTLDEDLFHAVKRLHFRRYLIE